LQILAEKGLRRRLVGFRMSPPRGHAPRESHLVIHGGRVVGRVTSSSHSPTLDAVIGLAVVPPELAHADSKLDIRCAGGRLRQARIVPLPFYDPDNERQRC
jgi:sarcosine oxidase subunit alpha